MKKLFLVLTFVLLLTGCGKNRQIFGEVVSVTNEGQYVQLTVHTDDGMDIPVLAGGESLVYSFDGVIPHEQLLTGELIRPIVTAYELSREDGAWLAERICVESIQLPEGYTLKDGTVLTVRRNYNHTTYLAADETEILREEDPVGPNNVYVGGLPSLDDLEPEAQEKIIAYYDELGPLYNLNAEMENAYRDYMAMEDKSGFQSRILSQDICPTAANEKLIWYGTHVTRPVDSGLHHQTSTYTVFDRETGEVVEPASLFLCSEAEAAKAILDGSGISDTELRNKMEKAFRFDYLNFNSLALDVCFPAGSLPGQDTYYILGIEYEHLSGVLHPWAIPDSTEP